MNISLEASSDSLSMRRFFLGESGGVDNPHCDGRCDCDGDCGSAFGSFGDSLILNQQGKKLGEFGNGVSVMLKKYPCAKLQQRVCQLT